MTGRDPWDRLIDAVRADPDATRVGLPPERLRGSDGRSGSSTTVLQGMRDGLIPFQPRSRSPWPWAGEIAGITVHHPKEQAAAGGPSMRAAAPSTRAQHRALQEASRLPFDIPGSSEREVAGQALEEVGLGLMFGGALKAASPVLKRAPAAARKLLSKIPSRERMRANTLANRLERIGKKLDKTLSKMPEGSSLEDNKELVRLSQKENETYVAFQRADKEANSFARTGERGATFTPDPTAEGWGAMVDVFGTPTHSGLRPPPSSRSAVLVRGQGTFMETPTYNPFRDSYNPDLGDVMRGMPVNPVEDVELLDAAFTTKGKKLTKKGAAHNVLFSPDVRAQVTGGERLGGILDLLDNVQLPTEKSADELTNTLARLLARKYSAVRAATASELTAAQAYTPAPSFPAPSFLSKGARPDFRKAALISSPALGAAAYQLIRNAFGKDEKK